MKIRAWLGVAITLVCRMPADAQSPGIVGPRPAALYGVSIPLDTALHQSVVYNWQEPALIGGALLGSFVNLVGYGFCAGGEGTRSNCALGSEVGFLMGAVVGGGTAGLIGSTSKPRVTPPGYERDGDQRVRGALMLAVPSLAIDGWGFLYLCNQPRFLSRTNDGCNAGNLVISLMAGALNAWIGSQIGKGIPAYRKVD